MHYIVLLSFFGILLYDYSVLSKCKNDNGLFPLAFFITFNYTLFLIFPSLTLLLFITHPFLHCFSQLLSP